MAYQNHAPYGNGYAQQQYSNPQYNGFVDPRQMSQAAVNGYVPFNSNAYHTNGHSSPYGPQSAPNGMQQHLHMPQTYQSLPPQQRPQYTPSQQQRPAIPQQQRHPPNQHPQQQQQRQHPLTKRQPQQQHQEQHRPPQSQHQQQPQQQHQQKPTQPQQQQAYAVVIPALSPPPTLTAHDGYVHMSDIQKQASSTPPLDYQMLLLSMADEYFAAAYRRGSIADIVRRESEIQEYYKLIATGLGCLDTLLKQYKLAPETEANVRLRYATILYEETENTMEAEETLSKGISICDRYKYFDLKYNMQHLLARAMFTKNAKAAFKFLDGVTADAKAYQHNAWVYAFRFLKVSLHLGFSSQQDLSAVLALLRSITHLAREHGDKAILATATTMEALVYLKEPGESGGFEQAQRALASVRSLQLDPDIAHIPQLTVFISFVDISCHLQRFYPSQALSSMHNMQTALAKIVDGDPDGSDGLLAIPVSKANMPQSKTENGIIKPKADGSLVLMFNWMPNEDIYNAGFLMSGIAMAHKNTTDGHKSEQMFLHGVQRQQWAQKASEKVVKSVMLALKQQSWREHMAYYMRLHHAFSLASRTSWSSAREQVTELKKLRNAWPDVPNDLFLLSQYLKGTIAQGTGDLSAAFTIYESVVNGICPAEQQPQGLQSQTSLRNLTQLSRELYILSTLNICQVIRDSNHPNHHQFDTLLTQVTPYCTRSPNRGIVSAYSLISAACPASSKIITTKQALHSALESAKATGNNKLMCVVLNIMSWKFFSGVVGEQAEKSARAGQALAKKSADTLWTCVAAGILAETLEAAGRIEEAAQARSEGELYAEELPEMILEVMLKTPEEDTMMSGMGQLYENALQG